MNGKESVVSSAHLADNGPASLSALEYGLIGASGSFARWVARCMTAAGWPNLGYLDVLALHPVYHRDREKRVSGICLVLRIVDTYTIPMP